jgi:hypothetical protein
MSLRNERLLRHCEGRGRLRADGGTDLAVRYVLDTWCETIATGSGTSAEMLRSDGFIWWEGVAFPKPACTLETDQDRYRVNLCERRAQRARFYCLD